MCFFSVVFLPFLSDPYLFPSIFDNSAHCASRCIDSRRKISAELKNDMFPHWGQLERSLGSLYKRWLRNETYLCNGAWPWTRSSCRAASNCLWIPGLTYITCTIRYSSVKYPLWRFYCTRLNKKMITLCCFKPNSSASYILLQSTIYDYF